MARDVDLVSWGLLFVGVGCIYLGSSKIKIISRKSSCEVTHYCGLLVYVFQVGRYFDAPHAISLLGKR